MDDREDRAVRKLDKCDEDEIVDVDSPTTALICLPTVSTTVDHQSEPAMNSKTFNRKRSRRSVDDDDNDSEDGDLSSRKQKSLGLLCQR